MSLEFLDTNIFIRYLTQDNPEQSQRSYQLLQEVEAGTIQVTTCEGVIIEVVYVLSSRALYNLPRQEIRKHLNTILSLRGLKILNKRVYFRALSLYADTSMDFVDCLAIAHMQKAKIDTILSFDHDFDRIQGINRREP